MNPYYQSLLQQIQEELDQEAYDRAYSLIQTELELPYVPQEALEVLEAYRDQCKPQLQSSKIDHALEDLVQGNMAMQEKAVALLKTMNLHTMSDLVQKLLDSDDLLDEIKGELIESLMEQKVDTPYHIKKSGLEITFVPSVIIPADQDEVVLAVRDLFDQWFSNDNPTFHRFCNRLLEQEVLENRPMDLVDCSAISIAKSIVRIVSDAFGQSDEFLLFVKEKQLENVVEIPLLIERRGEDHE